MIPSCSRPMTRDIVLAYLITWAVRCRLIGACWLTGCALCCKSPTWSGKDLRYQFNALAYPGGGCRPKWPFRPLHSIQIPHQSVSARTAWRQVSGKVSCWVLFLQCTGITRLGSNLRLPTLWEDALSTELLSHERTEYYNDQFLSFSISFNSYVSLSSPL